jgi:hypothetical protein
MTGSTGYSLKGNGTDMSKFGPNGSYFACSGMTSMSSVNYMHVEPNSHFYTDLNQLINTIEFGWLNPEIGKEQILIGLNNTLKNGYTLRLNNKKKFVIAYPCFISMQQMIEYVSDESFSQNAFHILLKETVKYGLNLSNGLKMERKEIYNRIDGERNYQDENWGTRRTLDGTPDEEKPVAEWINYIEFHVAKAKDKVYHLDTLGATDELRKVAALAVRALEIHGCPTRDVAPKSKK